MSDISMAVAFASCVWLGYYAVKAFYQDVWKDKDDE